MNSKEKIVLLHKDLYQPGFVLLDTNFEELGRQVNYVRMVNVTFDIYEEKKRSDRRTVHAVARGTLQAALPIGASPNPDHLRKFFHLIEVDYRPNKPDSFFYTVNDGKQIHSAETLYGYAGVIRVETVR